MPTKKRNTEISGIASPISVEREGSDVKQAGRFSRLVVPSFDTGAYDINTPSVQPNTVENSPQISDFEYIFWTNPVVHKGTHIKKNRVIGPGFKLLPSDHPDAEPGIAQEAADRCWKFYQRIGGYNFSGQSLLNAYVAGNEWTEIVYNFLHSAVSATHADFRTVDFRRNFLSNKIILDEFGEPTYWQYVENLAELYYPLSADYGNIPAYKNQLAAQKRLKKSQSIELKNSDGEVIGIATAKPLFMFLKKDEIVHLSVNKLNDNLFGVSSILPAYNALVHMEQVMYATAEAINEMGYPKPVVKVGDETHSATPTLMTEAANMIKNPRRKEGFAIPYPMDLKYLEPSTSSGNINDYPQFFIKAVAMGLRIPVELLTGEGESNRATGIQNSTDFSLDVEGDRRAMDRYHEDIFNLFLNSHGYGTSSGGRSIYIPKIVWPSMISEDQALRQKIVMEQWQNGAIKFESMQKALDLEVDEADPRNELYIDELQGTNLQSSTGSGASGIGQGYEGTTENKTAQESAKFRLSSPGPVREMIRRARMERDSSALIDGLEARFAKEDAVQPPTPGKQVKRNIARTIAKATYRQPFKGLTKSETQQALLDIIHSKLFEEGGQQAVAKKLTDTYKIPIDQADMIVRTETHEFENVQRSVEFADSKVKWLGPDDKRTTSICKKISQAAKDGVSVPELKSLIAQFADSNTFDPTRPFSPHINCRHVMVPKSKR